MRLRHLAIALILGAFFIAADTPIDLHEGGTPGWNLVTGATINATENTVTITISAGKPRTIQFVSADTDWYYRSATSGTNLAVAKGQTLTLRYNKNTVVYFVRQAADGNLTILPILQPGDL